MVEGDRHRTTRRCALDVPPLNSIPLNAIPLNAIPLNVISLNGVRWMRLQWILTEWCPLGTVLWILSSQYCPPSILSPEYCPLNDVHWILSDAVWALCAHWTSSIGIQMRNAPISKKKLWSEWFQGEIHSAKKMIVQLLFQMLVPMSNGIHNVRTSNLNING